MPEARTTHVARGSKEDNGVCYTWALPRNDGGKSQLHNPKTGSQQHTTHPRGLLLHNFDSSSTVNSEKAGEDKNVNLSSNLRIV